MNILFICLGNICRSPMAEFIMKELLRREGLPEKGNTDSQYHHNKCSDTAMTCKPERLETQLDKGTKCLEELIGTTEMHVPDLIKAHPVKAELKEKTCKEQLSENITVLSAGVSDEEDGNPVYPPAARMLRAHGIPMEKHRAHRVTRAEFEAADIVAVMDDGNLRGLERMFGKDAAKAKVRKLMEFAGIDRNVADPWYTGDFETAYRDIERGCRALLNHISGDTTR